VEGCGGLRAARVALALGAALGLAACDATGQLVNGQPNFNTQLLMPSQSNVAVSTNSPDARRTSMFATATLLTPDKMPLACVTTSSTTTTTTGTTTATTGTTTTTTGTTTTTTGTTTTTTAQAAPPTADAGAVPPTPVVTVQPATTTFSSTTTSLPGGLRPCFYALKTIIDDQYREYKIALAHIVNGGTTLADLANLGVTTAATATPGAAAKTLLSAIAASISGGKAIVDSDLLYKQTIVITINEMDADRAQIETQMLTRLNSTTAPLYSLEEAENDLLGYYEAGTFTHALVSLQTKTAANQANCSAQAQNAKTSGANAGATTTATSTGCPATTPSTTADPGIALSNAAGLISIGAGKTATITLIVSSLTAEKAMLLVNLPSGVTLAGVTANGKTATASGSTLTIDSTVISSTTKTGTIVFTFNGFTSGKITVDAIPINSTGALPMIKGLYTATVSGS
jgi:hypothetical protein